MSSPDSAGVTSTAQDATEAAPQLEILLASLAAHQARIPPPPGGYTTEIKIEALRGLPLFHRLGRPLESPAAAMENGHIILQVPQPKAGRAELGLDSFIFTSIGVAAYLSPPVILAFGPLSVMQEYRHSLPWDSRGAGKPMKWSLKTHQEYVKQFTLPAPHDEVYLAQHLSLYFLSWLNFLRGGRPWTCDETGLFGYTMNQPSEEDLAWLTTPEARFNQNLELSAQLIAAFVDEDYPDGSNDPDGWSETFLVIQRIVEKHEGKFFRMRRTLGAIDYRRQAADFVWLWLREKGYIE